MSLKIDTVQSLGITGGKLWIHLPRLFCLGLCLLWPLQESSVLQAITLRLWIFECRHPSYEAFKLGMVATVLLTLAHVAAVMLSGCVCIGSKEELDQSSNIKRLAAASHVLAWYEITFIAFCPHTNYNHRLVNNKELRNCLVSEN